MKTVGNLITAIKGFVFNNTNYTDLFQGGTSSEDLETKLNAAIMVAINNARKWAERKHDFEFTFDSLSVEVTAGAKVDLAEEGIKTLKSVWYEDTPLDIWSQRELEIRQRTKRLRGLGHEPLWVDGFPVVIVEGQKIKFYPAMGETLEVNVAGYRWLADYELPEDVDDDDQSDWLIEHGFDFLMWQSIIELNHIVQIFVPRQEGSLAPPERLRDSAWETLLVCDSNGLAGGIWHG